MRDLAIRLAIDLERLGMCASRLWGWVRGEGAMTVVDIVAGLERGETFRFEAKYWGLFFEELAKYGKQVSLDVEVKGGLVILRGRATA